MVTLVVHTHDYSVFDYIIMYSIILQLDNSPLKMIRNEFIKDNAVAKQEGPPLPGKVVNLIQIEYNFIPVRIGRVNAFSLQNGSKCLQNNGYILARKI